MAERPGDPSHVHADEEADIRASVRQVLGLEMAKWVIRPIDLRSKA
jgi:hypothetical protein